MHVHRLPRIVTRKHRRKLRHPIRIRHPRAAQERLLIIRPRVRRQQPAELAPDLRLLVLQAGKGRGVPGVMSCGIRVPDVDEDVGKGAACLDVDDADVEELII